MKLIITKEELRRIISQQYALPANIEVEIVNDNSALKNIIVEISKMAYTSTDKIKAIKRFREVVPCGLAEAKWAVEHWVSVYCWIDNNNRAPIFEYSNCNGYTMR